LGELLRPIRLLQQRARGHDISRITRREQNLQPGLLLTCSPRHFATVEPGHDNVGKQQIDLRMLANQEESGGPVGCRQHGIAAFLQDIARIIEDAGIIIHDDDRTSR